MRKTIDSGFPRGEMNQTTLEDSLCRASQPKDLLSLDQIVTIENFRSKRYLKRSYGSRNGIERCLLKFFRSQSWRRIRHRDRRSKSRTHNYQWWRLDDHGLFIISSLHRFQELQIDSTTILLVRRSFLLVVHHRCPDNVCALRDTLEQPVLRRDDTKQRLSSASRPVVRPLHLQVRHNRLEFLFVGTFRSRIVDRWHWQRLYRPSSWDQRYLSPSRLALEHIVQFIFCSSSNAPANAQLLRLSCHLFDEILTGVTRRTEDENIQSIGHDRQTRSRGKSWAKIYCD